MPTKPAPKPKRIKCPCKVNLYLCIEGIREDGYHELTTLFFPIEAPYDSLAIEDGPANSGLTLECRELNILPESNLVYKAYSAFASKTGFRPDIKVSLEKCVPSGAGLGGGSSDAAALLVYLNSCAGSQALKQEELSALAATLGADVPFFLLNTPALAGGIGEKLSPVKIDLSEYSILLVCPDVHVSTPWAYKEWDRRNNLDEIHKKSSLKLTAPTERAMCPFCLEPMTLFNSFEAAVFPTFPRLREIKEELLRLGASGAVMSGSGASIVSFFKKEEDAKRAQFKLGQTGIKTFLKF